MIYLQFQTYDVAISLVIEMIKMNIAKTLLVALTVDTHPNVCNNMVATKNNNILWLRTLLALTPSPAPPLSLFRRIIWWPFPTSTRRKSQTVTGQNICYFCQEIERNLMTSFNTYVTLLHL